jgi:hypothetical protein
MTIDYSEIEKRISECEQRMQVLEQRAEEANAWKDIIEEASQIIQALARLIAGWEHLPAVPTELQERAERFGADFSG